MSLPDYYGMIAERTGDDKLKAKAAGMLYSQMERFIQYAVYNRAMASRFGTGVSMTTESRLLPYQFSHFVELYERYGGDPKKTDELLKRNGYTHQELQQMYDAAYGGGNSGAEGYTAAELIEELAGYAKVVNQLAPLDAAAYAGRSADERNVDSLYYAVMQQVLKAGVTNEELNSNEDIRKVDVARSKRLTEEYMRNHPGF